MRSVTSDAPPMLREIADHIERRMQGKSGAVTLHFKSGNIERIQYGDYEDARAIPRRGA